MRVNPGSKRGQVRICYHEKGQDDANALAAKLGIPESRRRRWFKMWNEEAPASLTVAKTKTAPAPASSSLSVRAVKALREDPKNRVRYVGGRGLGTIVQRGPQQSLVRWDNGNETLVVNEWVEPA